MVNQTDKKIKEISNNIEIFIRKRKIILIIIGTTLLLGLLVVLFGNKGPDLENLESKMQEVEFNVEKTENTQLLEGTTRIIEAGEKGLRKEYYEVVGGKEVLKAIDENCKKCKKPKTQIEQIGKFPINQAEIDSKQVVQNYLQYIKEADYREVMKYVANDGVKNIKTSKLRELYDNHGYQLKDFVLRSCYGDKNESKIMKVDCEVDLTYHINETGDIKKKEKVSTIYDKGKKKWSALYSFPYEIQSLRGEKGSTYHGKVDATINSSKVETLGELDYIIKYVRGDNMMRMILRTTHIFDFYDVNEYMVYEEMFKKKDGKGYETKVLKKDLGKTRVHIRDNDEYRIFNRNSKFKKIKEGVYETPTIFPVKKYELVNRQKFQYYAIEIQPGIKTVNPYLKFPKLLFKIDFDKPFIPKSFNLITEE